MKVLDVKLLFQLCLCSLSHLRDLQLPHLLTDETRLNPNVFHIYNAYCKIFPAEIDTHSQNTRNIGTTLYPKAWPGQVMYLKIEELMMFSHEQERTTFAFQLT